MVLSVVPSPCWKTTQLTGKKHWSANVLLSWRLLRRGRGWRLGVRAQEGDLGTRVFRRERDDANLVAAFANERDVIIGNVGVAEGFG